MALRVYTLKEKSAWRQLVTQFPNCDVYYLPEYLEIQEEVENGTALLATWQSPELGGMVAYPFLKRAVPQHEGLFDTITAYGYGGPIFSGPARLATEAIRGFRLEFDIYCHQAGIVSEFIRFHPLLENNIGDCGTLKTEYVRDTVVVEIDSHLDPMDTFPPKTRNMVRKAQRSGIRVSLSYDEAALDEFIPLYYQTMERRNALRYYFFPRLFFKRLMKELDPKPFILTASFERRAVASALFIRYGPFLHYHFSGSDRSYQHFGPNNLIIYHAALEGGKLGAKRFHLGGGYLEPEDSLFRFKASFSEGRGRFYVGRAIHNRQVYDELCAEHGRVSGKYFPGYRS